VNRWASRKHNEQPVFLHLDFDDFEGDQMIKESDAKYILWRMVPPGIHKYFVSISKFRTSFVYNQPVVDNEEAFVTSTYSSSQEIKMPQTGEVAIVLAPDRVNLVKAVAVEDFMSIDKWAPNHVHVCVPRPGEKVFRKEMHKRPTPTWHFRDSVFKDYRVAGEELLAECFEFDWAHVTKPRLKEQESYEPVKAALRRAYPFL